MKKLSLSFGLIITFAFYLVFNNSKSVALNLPPTQTSGTSNQQPQSQAKASAPITSGNNFGEDNNNSEDEISRSQSGSSAPPTNTPAATQPPVQPAPPMPIVQSGAYRNGSYTGNVADAYYGNVQVKAIISGGKISDVQFLDYPHDRGTSIRINNQAMPYLTQEAIQAQSASIDVISGATATSGAFNESLASALAQAKN